MNMTLNCIIVDDEPLALDLLESYVKRTPFLNLVAKCSSGFDVFNIRDKQIDLAFLDIQMPQLNGLELSKMLESCMVIFTTAFEQYAIEGFKVSAIDYLLKPFSYGEFLSAANKALKHSELLKAANGNTEKEINNIVIKADYRQQVIDTNRIVYIEAIRDYLKLHLDDNTTIQTLMTLKGIEEILPKKQFARVHRSFIVNIEKVTIIERSNIVFGKTYIPISDSYKDNFQDMFNSQVLKKR